MCERKVFSHPLFCTRARARRWELTMKRKFLTTQEMVQIALFTAILAILSQISFMLPGGIPVTLQTFGIVLIGTILGKKSGFLSVFLYLLIGMIGIPVFANFGGGIDALVGPTGGYLFGFLPMVFLTGLGSRKSYHIGIFFSILGLLICHVMGLLFYYQITGTWLLPSVPLMLAKDLVTTVVAVSLGREIYKILSRMTTGLNRS